MLNFFSEQTGDWGFSAERAYCYFRQTIPLCEKKNILDALNIKALVLLIHEGSCSQQNASKSVLDPGVHHGDVTEIRIHTCSLTNSLSLRSTLIIAAQ